MAGLLGDVLPFVYSQADRLKRRVGGLLGDPLGTLTQAVNDANDRAGGLLGQTRAAAMEGLNYGPATQRLAGTLADSYNPAGITVWHGSPHKFSRFDSSKIGTGEGAQAYGHGLYLAESPEVARGYSMLADNNPTAQQYLRMWGGDRSKAEAAFLKDVSEGAFGKYTSQIAKDGDVLASIRGKGQVYKVDLPDSAVAKMLDWDKPLSQQAPEVRAAIDAMQKRNPAGWNALVEAQLGGPVMDQAVGRDLYRKMAGSNEAASVDAMRSLGIPGIRYLDGGSRGAGTGTSNFVVFPGEESLLTILERNGMPLPK